LKTFTVAVADASVNAISVDADHFSINSQTGGAQFYRFPPKTDRTDTRNGVVPLKDELVGSAPGGAFVTLDEKTAVLEGVLGDLSDVILDKLADALGVDELADEQKIRIAVTFTE
jgi:hypothetical protein